MTALLENERQTLNSISIRREVGAYRNEKICHLCHSRIVRLFPDQGIIILSRKR
jgi:hypothetical protein